MTNLKGLILDFGGVLTTPLAPAALAFEKRAGLPEGALINALYLDEGMVRPPSPLEPHRIEPLDVLWRDRRGGVLHEYRHAA